MSLPKSKITALSLSGLGLILVVVFTFGKTQTTKTIKGIVTDGESNMQFAPVKIKATNNSTKTDYYGAFSLQVNDGFDSLTIAAWAEGYYNSDINALPGDTGVVIRLKKLFKEDNKNYKFISPFSDEGNDLNCQNCHTNVLMDQWKNNAHGQSAKNPFFLAMYYGTNYSESESSGVSFKSDFPTSYGNCATCHIPGAAIDDPWGIDPNSVSEINKNGVYCDVCHKIKDVIPNSGQGTTGTLSIDFLRPTEGEQVFFGPYIDVHEPDAYSPIISTSEFCMPCHNAKFWGVPAYQTFNEWNESIYPQLNIQCQTCHMAPDSILTNFAPGKGGVERDPLTIPSHSQPGSRDTTILKNSVTMSLSAAEVGDSIKVQVVVYNDKTGHHVPAGRPSRNMILLVEASNESTGKLDYISGDEVPFWAGKGEVNDGNYSGLPGKGFVKLLQDFLGEIPAPVWRPTNIVSDNRIPAMGSDTSEYIFRKPENYQNIRIAAKLVYRRFYKKWMVEKEFDIPDIIMEEESIILNNPSTAVYESELPHISVSQNFPNPFIDETSFQINIAESKNINIQVFNINGLLVSSEEPKYLLRGKNLVTINLSGLTSGIYYCSFTFNHKTITTKKIVKYGN